MSHIKESDVGKPFVRNGRYYVVEGFVTVPSCIIKDLETGKKFYCGADSPASRTYKRLVEEQS